MNFKCRFCDKIIANKGGLTAHEISCKNNPQRKKNPVVLKKAVLHGIKVFPKKTFELHKQEKLTIGRKVLGFISQERNTLMNIDRLFLKRKKNFIRMDGSRHVDDAKNLNTIHLLQVI